MGQHDAYGKALLKTVAGPACDLRPAPIDVGRMQVRIDAVVGDRIAVEIEARTAKQVRGAIVDLILHSAPCKLLLLLPAHHHSTGLISEHCRTILGRLLPHGVFEVVELSGTGLRPDPVEDAARIRQALVRLGHLRSSRHDDAPTSRPA